MKVIIDYYNRRSSSLNSIILLIKDIWGFSQDLNIYHCCHIYEEVNIITDGLAIKGIYNTNPKILCSSFSRDYINFGFEEYCDLSFNDMYK